MAKASVKASEKPSKAETKKFRLVTRSDFDGLVCGILLRELDMIADVKFVHPKDVQDGKVELSKSDITTNLPYDARVNSSAWARPRITLRTRSHLQPRAWFTSTSADASVLPASVMK
jgi:hypothetical protein